MRVFFLTIAICISSVSLLWANPPKTDYLITISTPEGDMQVILYENTPVHKKKFLEMIENGYFKNKPIYRVIEDLGIHFGDGKDMKNIVKDERVNPHKKGALASLRIKDDDNPEKSSSLGQFYIVNSDKDLSFLNNAYTVFGQVITGLDVIDKLNQQEIDKDYLPTKSLRFSITSEEMKPKKITKLTGYTYP